MVVIGNMYMDNRIVFYLVDDDFCGELNVI